jgi:hypothetical protein
VIAQRNDLKAGTAYLRVSDGTGTTKCNVPKVVGDTLPKAELALVNAGCSSRVVEGSFGGQVLSQHPNSGRIEPGGAVVSLTMSAHLLLRPLPGFMAPDSAFR